VSAHEYFRICLIHLKDLKAKIQFYFRPCIKLNYLFTVHTRDYSQTPSAVFWTAIVLRSVN